MPKSCLRKPTRVPAVMLTLPVSGVIFPQIMFNRVDFPLPFKPISPILSLLVTFKFTSERTSLEP